MTTTDSSDVQIRDLVTLWTRAKSLSEIFYIIIGNPRRNVQRFKVCTSWLKRHVQALRTYRGNNLKCFSIENLSKFLKIFWYHRNHRNLRKSQESNKTIRNPRNLYNIIKIHKNLTSQKSRTQFKWFTPRFINTKSSLSLMIYDETCLHFSHVTKRCHQNRLTNDNLILLNFKESSASHKNDIGEEKSIY